MEQTIEKGFIVLGNSINLPNGLKEFDLGNGYTIKRADVHQAEWISEMFYNTGNRYFAQMHFESIVKETENGYSFKRIEQSKDWNYWIVEHEEYQADSEIKTALLLSKPDLYSLCQKVRGTGSLAQIYGFQNYINDIKGQAAPKILNDRDLQEFRELYQQMSRFNGHSEDYPYIKKSLSDFWYLLSVPKSSPFFTLGMFSIIESLLVHNSESVPILHQIRSKLNLLNNRFEDHYKISIHEYFGEGRFETLIGKLYSYRSDIAHGDFSDFAKELKVLGDPKRVSGFIYQVLKSLLIHSLSEPQLIKDLKNC